MQGKKIYIWLPIVVSMLTNILAIFELNDKLIEHKLHVYILILIIIVVTNIFRIDDMNKRPWYWRLRRYIPTFASISRAAITIILIIPLSGSYYKPHFPFVYLLYFGILCSTFGSPYYNTRHWRWVRIIADFLFAGIIFFIYDGFKNIGWIAFLIPIATLGRYYKSKYSFVLGVITMIYIFIVSTLAFSPEIYIFIKNCIGYGISYLFNNIDLLKQTFQEYLNYNPNRLIYWATLKNIALSWTIIIFIIILYYEETKNRIQSIFNFGRYLNIIWKNTGREINIALLNFLCYEINCECVFYLNTANKQLKASFQTKNDNFETIDEMLPEKIFKKMKNLIIKHLDEKQTKHRPESIMETVRHFERYKRESVSESTIPDIFLPCKTENITLNDFSMWAYEIPEGEQFFKHFNEIFFYEKAIESRKKAALYKEFTISSLVALKVGTDRYFFFINNFSYDYRVAPRPFWNDGLEKIYFVKTCLE